MESVPQSCPPPKGIFYQLPSVSWRLFLQLSEARLPCSWAEHAAQETFQAESQVQAAEAGEHEKDESGGRSRALTVAD